VAVTLTYRGRDVRLVRRLASGRAVIEYTPRGEPSGLTVNAWAFELHGHPDGIAGIKRAIDALPDPNAPAPTPTPSQQDTRPRAFLHAHFAAGNDDREE
jgi:hypothetical protein